MRVYLQYPQQQYSGDYNCESIEYVPGFIVLHNVTTPDDWAYNAYRNLREPIRKPIPQVAFPSQPILEVRVYNE